MSDPEEDKAPIDETSKRLRHCRTLSLGLGWDNLQTKRVSQSLDRGAIGEPLPPRAPGRAPGTISRRRVPGSLRTRLRSKARIEVLWCGGRVMPTSQPSQSWHGWIGFRPSKEREIFPSRRLQKGLASSCHARMGNPHDGMTASQPHSFLDARIGCRKE